MTEAETATHPDESSTLILNPYVRVLWRANDVVQLELGNRRLVLQGVTTPALTALLGKHLRAASRSDTERLPGATPGLGKVIKELRLAGFMVTETRSDTAPPSWLASEFGAVTATNGDAAHALLRQRATSVVRVDGTSRLAVTIGAILSTAGIGHVSVNGCGLARLNHCGPGALKLSDEGERFSLAAARRIREHAPTANTGPPPLNDPPHLVILADDSPPDPDDVARLQQQRQPHLLASATADQGIVGPAVIPGRSSCHRCADLHRLDRDEAWSVLAAQLAVTPRRTTGAPVALSTIVAGLAGAQALALLDGDDVTTFNGTLEVRPPDYRVRRRTWEPHGDCRCIS